MAGGRRASTCARGSPVRCNGTSKSMSQKPLQHRTLYPHFVHRRRGGPLIDANVEVVTEAQAIAGLNYSSRVTFSVKHLVTNRDRLSHAAALARSASSTRGARGSSDAVAGRDRTR